MAKFTAHLIASQPGPTADSEELRRAANCLITLLLTRSYGTPTTYPESSTLPEYLRN
jgi:hypothetical protein